MKRVGGLWPRILAFDNLLLAFRKARRGKRDRAEVARFELDLEPHLLRLQEELARGCYHPGRYRLFDIYDRKPRRIAAAPFRDRVVHHALMNGVEPALDRTFIDDSYACRTGKGVHVAVARYQGWAPRHAYALKLDVRRYFPSIDHALLKAKLRRRLKEPEVLRLFDLIIDSASPSDDPPRAFPGDDLVDLMERRRGLPIGNLTSQFLANLYLDDLDHVLKETCRVRAYLRYVDDLMVLGDDKSELWALRAAIDDFLARERLVLHPHKAHIHHTADGVEWLGIACSRTTGACAATTAIAFAAGCAPRRRNTRWGNSNSPKCELASTPGSATSATPTAKVCAERCWVRYASRGRRIGRCARRVVRGGGWNNEPENVRSANRNRNAPDEANNNLGFRLARTPALVAGASGVTDPLGVPAGAHGPPSGAPQGRGCRRDLQGTPAPGAGRHRRTSRASSFRCSEPRDGRASSTQDARLNLDIVAGAGIGSGAGVGSEGSSTVTHPTATHPTGQSGWAASDGRTGCRRSTPLACRSLRERTWSRPGDDPDRSRAFPHGLAG